MQCHPRGHPQVPVFLTMPHATYSPSTDGLVVGMATSTVVNIDTLDSGTTVGTTVGTTATEGSVTVTAELGSVLIAGEALPRQDVFDDASLAAMESRTLLLLSDNDQRAIAIGRDALEILEAMNKDSSRSQRVIARSPLTRTDGSTALLTLMKLVEAGVGHGFRFGPRTVGVMLHAEGISSD